MKKFWFLCLSAIIAISTVSFGPAGASGSERKFIAASDAIPGRYVVVMDTEKTDTFSADDSEGLARLYGGKVTRQYESAFKGFAVEMSARSAKAMSKDSRVKWVAEDQEFSVSTTQAPATWGLDRIDQRSLPLNSAYIYGTTGAGVNVYVIDTGIRVTHQEFAGRAIRAFDSMMDGQDANDCHGHGTHVAATIGGATSGVAKGVRLYAVRVLGCDGLGSLSSILSGVDWVDANAARPAVANMSLGGNANELLNMVIESTIAHGITFVAAAGNSNLDACTISPASAPNVITVGASNKFDQRWASSNVGSCLDLFAPGVDITSAGIGSDSEYKLASGTSMASPHVTGTVALFLQANPAASPLQATQSLLSRATSGKLTDVDASSPNLLVNSIALAPTAAMVRVSGAVKTPKGTPIRGALVTLSNPLTSETFAARTNVFGYFKFNEVEVGSAYSVSVSAKGYDFPSSTQVFMLTDNISDILFVGVPAF